MSIIAYGLIALAILVSLIGIGHSLKASGENEERLRWQAAAAKQSKLDLENGRKASSALEADRGKTRTIFRTITQSVDKYIDRPVYRNVCFDDDGLRDANRALIGPTAPASEPDRTVPTPHAPTGRLGSNGASETDRSVGGVLRLRLETRTPSASG